jgi:hypothetical protein
VKGIDLLLRVLMPRANHLWEIDDNRFPVSPLDQDVEFVKVTMNKTGVREFENKGHQFRVQVGRVGHFVDLSTVLSAESGCGTRALRNLQWIRVDQRHNDTVTGLVDRYRYRKAMRIQHLFR